MSGPTFLLVWVHEIGVLHTAVRDEPQVKLAMAGSIDRLGLHTTDGGLVTVQGRDLIGYALSTPERREAEMAHDRELDEETHRAGVRLGMWAGEEDEPWKR